MSEVDTLLHEIAVMKGEAEPEHTSEPTVALRYRFRGASDPTWFDGQRVEYTIADAIERTRICSFTPKSHHTVEILQGETVVGTIEDASNELIIEALKGLKLSNAVEQGWEGPRYKKGDRIRIRDDAAGYEAVHGLEGEIVALDHDGAYTYKVDLVGGGGWFVDEEHLEPVPHAFQTGDRVKVHYESYWNNQIGTIVEIEAPYYRVQRDSDGEIGGFNASHLELLATLEGDVEAHLAKNTLENPISTGQEDAVPKWIAEMIRENGQLQVRAVAKQEWGLLCKLNVKLSGLRGQQHVMVENRLEGGERE